MRRNRQWLRRLLRFLFKGGVENIPELLANIVCARAGAQAELDENRLPVVDAVNGLARVASSAPGLSRGLTTGR